MIDAAIIEHARCISLIYPVIGEVDGVCIHDIRNA